MRDRQFTRGQTQILYRHLPGSVFSHDDYGLCIVDEVTVDAVDSVNRSALFDTLFDTLSQWEEESFCRKFPDPRDNNKRKRYRIGQPREVLFTPFPRVMECRKCGHVIDYDKLSNTRGLKPGHCVRDGCDGLLRQLPYVEAHNCGRMQQMFVPGPSQGCPKHKTQHLVFFDPGRTAAARWKCGVCGRELQKPRMTPCQCEYTQALNSLGRPPYERFLRLYPTSEPGLYLPHVAAFINFPEEQERRLMQSADAFPLLLARVWGVLGRTVLEVTEERAQWGGEASGIPEDVRKLAEALEAVDPNHPLVLEHKKKKSSPPGEEAISQVTALLGRAMPVKGVPYRKLVEHVALQDNMSLTDIEVVSQRMLDRGEKAESQLFKEEALSGLDSLGLRNVSVVNDFPVALSALGFTRVSKSPLRSVFNPFPPDDDGRIPLFVIPTDTEGLWFQLDAGRVATWLSENGLADGIPPSGTPEAWAWLHRVALKDLLSSPVPESNAAMAVFMLVHSMSHVFLQRIQWSGFASSSIGEYLMAGTLSFVLYANRFAQSKIGGLTTLFEQRLPLWLRDASQSGRNCMYDPLCAEDGGSCAGCLHREHNCPVFNRDLSRSVLYGGPLPEGCVIGSASIKVGYWDM